MNKFLRKLLISWGFVPQPMYKNVITTRTLDVTSQVRKDIANKMGKMSGLMMNGLPDADSHWDAERQLVFGPREKLDVRDRMAALGRLLQEVEEDERPAESELMKFWRSTIGDGRDPVMDVLMPLVKIHHLGLRNKKSILGRFEQRYYLNNVEPLTPEELRRQGRTNPFG